jgi:hypothetical protein
MMGRGLAFWALLMVGFWFDAAPAEACLGCSCGGGSGTTGDLSATGGLAGLFAEGQRWMIQESLSFRSLSGYANERGEWFPLPVDGQVQALAGTLGLYFFPRPGTSLGIQLPTVGQRLSKATWGSFGALMPTAEPAAQMGLAPGDVLLQGTHVWHQGTNWLFGSWAGLGLPTGYSGDDASRLSGLGTFSVQTGVLALVRWGEAEFVTSVGGQSPIGGAAGVSGASYAGESLMYQVFGNYPLGDRFRVGLTLAGQTGVWRQVAQDGRLPSSRLSIIPGVQWAFGDNQGVRVALATTPPLGLSNTPTDWTLYLLGYQFVR